MRKRTWLAIAAGGALLVALAGGGAFIAQAGDDDGTSFLDRVAQKLGIDTPRLEQAIRDARNDEIDERVRAGDLTQEEADRLKERLDELPADAQFGFGGRFEGKGLPWGGPHGFGFGPGLIHAPDAVAEFLGIEREQLFEELSAEDATLATVAEDHGKSRDELKAFLTRELKARLDEAVAGDDLTQERADEILERFNEHVDDLIDSGLPGLSAGAFELGRGPGPGFLLKAGAGLLELPGDVAGFLGIDREQLFEELMAEDATLATVAEAHGKSRDELKAFLADDMKTRLDEAVADDDLTQERADEILERFNEHLDDLIDLRLPRLPAIEGFDFEEFEGGEFEFEGGPFRFRFDIERTEPANSPESPEPPASGPGGGLSEALFR